MIDFLRLFLSLLCKLELTHFCLLLFIDLLYIKLLLLKLFPQGYIMQKLGRYTSNVVVFYVR